MRTRLSMLTLETETVFLHHLRRVLVVWEAVNVKSEGEQRGDTIEVEALESDGMKS